MEIWENIKGYEGMYQASNLGNVRSLNYKKTGKVQNLKPALDPKGYLRTSLMKGGILKTVKVHRVILQTFTDNVNNKPQVNHKNGIKTDNRLDNLEWCNNSENQIHAVKHNLVSYHYGDTHHKVKIMNEILKEIVIKNINGVPKRQLAKEYNISRNIFKRKFALEVYNSFK